MGNFIGKIFILPILTLIRFIITISMFVVLLAMFSPYIKDIHKYPYVNKALIAENTANTALKNNIPTVIADRDFSRIIEIIILLVLLEITRSSYDKVHVHIQTDELDDQVKKMRGVLTPNNFDSSTSKDHQIKMAELQTKMEEVKQATGKNRQELLKEFVNIKRELEKIGRDLAFLAIDVVDSTGMKAGEEFAVVEHDFNEYHNFVEAKFKENGYIRAAWTPDGVMASFNTIEDAVSAAKAIISGLDYFNRHVKEMKRNFAVRCGVNAGFVYIDDSVPLESISDRTIDIAGHMQKFAPPNKILIAKQIIEPIKFKDDFNPSERVIDGLEVYEWSDKT